MKKNILIFTAAAACVMLFAGCSSEEGPSELDTLIEQLQTTHLNTGSPEENTESEEAVPYKSLTGNVISFSEAEIKVKAEGKEQKFVVDENTQILGGDRSRAKTVTVTYCEPEKKSKSATANVITILELTETDTEGAVSGSDVQGTEAAETVSETISDVSAEAVSEAVSENTTDMPTETEPNVQADTESVTETEEPNETEPQSETAESQSESEEETEAETPAETQTNT